MKAIETTYAGCRFRSRLEARWAVFFEAMGITWEYEPQGFELSHRLTLEDGTFRYLPDFWLPELQLWAEVKGTLDTSELKKLLNASAALSAPTGGCGEGQGHDLVVFGPFTSEALAGFFPWRLHMHKGDLRMSVWTRQEGCDGFDLARDVGGSLEQVLHEAHPSASPSTVATQLLRGYPVTPGYDDERYIRAFAAARMARFEFAR